MNPQTRNDDQTLNDDLAHRFFWDIRDYEANPDRDRLLELLAEAYTEGYEDRGYDE